VQALGIGLPALGALGFALSPWIYAIPRFEDLGVRRGTIARVEIVRPPRSSQFGRVTLADGEVLYVRKMHAMRGVEEGLRSLRAGGSVTVWIDPHELERPHHHLAWQLHSQRESIFDFGELIGPLAAERTRFRIFCWILLIGGLILLVLGFGPRHWRDA
jgi:hypothetical protein